MSSDYSSHQPGPALNGHTPPPTPAGPIPGRKGPLAVLLSGVGLGIVGFTLLLIGAFSGVGGLMNAASDQEQLHSGEPSSLTTEADTMYGIFISGSESIQCYAENEGGAPVDLSTPGYQSQVNNREQVLVMETGPSDTHVMILCETDNEGDYFVGETVGSSLGGIAGPTVAGIALMGLGGILLIVGIIWLVIRQGQIKQARTQV